SFICHYVGASTAMANPNISDDLYRGNGEAVKVERSEGGGPCGTEYDTAVH
ncbi:MAG: phytanoyl-CoA dioxygenase family protein, partial [Paenibacillus sp.]|nr:phytanoyl-CoA dioxygenase family protein [Paenibacillus sp.]